MKGDIPEDFVENCLRPINRCVTSTPHKQTPMPDYTIINEDGIKTTVSASLGKSVSYIDLLIMYRM